MPLGNHNNKLCPQDYYKTFSDIKRKNLNKRSEGVGILKGLFGWAGKYQRIRGGVNLATTPSDMGEFPDMQFVQFW
jgi:hypothetical protein